MSTLGWIVASGLVMSAIALIGGVTLVLREATLQRIVLPLVAFAAGSLMVNIVHLGAFVASVALMWMIRVVLSH